MKHASADAPSTLVLHVESDQVAKAFRKNRSRRAHPRRFRFRPPDQRPHSYQGGGIAAVDEPLWYSKTVRVATKVFPLNRIVASLQQPQSVEYGQSHS